MTAVHGAAGEVPGGVFFAPAAGVEEPQITDEATAPARGNRRWFIGLGASGALAVTAAAVFGPRVLGGDGGSGSARGIGQADGGGGGAVTGGALFERPPAGDITIDTANPYHILEVTQNSDIDGRLATLMGTPNFRYVNPGRDQRYPWLQLSGQNGAQVTMSLRQAGTQGPTWSQARRPETQFAQLYPDTVVVVSDLFPRNTSVANVTGWANVGTSQEHMFSVETQAIPSFAGMAPEARREALLGFTHALFQARVFG